MSTNSYQIVLSRSVIDVLGACNSSRCLYLGQEDLLQAWATACSQIEEEACTTAVVDGDGDLLTKKYGTFG
jgi:hypothetical protein